TRRSSDLCFSFYNSILLGFLSSLSSSISFTSEPFKRYFNIFLNIKYSSFVFIPISFSVCDALRPLKILELCNRKLIAVATTFAYALSIFQGLSHTKSFLDINSPLPQRLDSSNYQKYYSYNESYQNNNRKQTPIPFS